MVNLGKEDWGDMGEGVLSVCMLVLINHKPNKQADAGQLERMREEASP